MDTAQQLRSWINGYRYCDHGLARCRACTREARRVGVLPPTEHTTARTDDPWLT